MKLFIIFVILGLIHGCSSHQKEADLILRKTASLDKDGDWDESHLFSESQMKSKSCRHFYEIATVQENELLEAQDLPKFMTDGIAVFKDGKLLWEWYDEQHDKGTPHVLWSASKTFTTTMIGLAIQDGINFQDKPFSLDRPVSDFYGGHSYLHPSMKAPVTVATVENLVRMNYPYKWNETYESDVRNSTFLPMLYLDGRFNMPDYAISQPRDKAANGHRMNPGDRLTYSGGNSNLLQGILKKLYPNRYENLPWELLFDKIGMKNTRWERDEAEHFVGSSYVYSTPREMAKYGMLYLNDGVWNGVRLLPEGWVQAATELEPAMGTSYTGKDYAVAVGMQSKKVFWLNTDIIRTDSLGGDGIKEGDIVYEKEFPNSPDNMFFTAGHYGQLIMMLPDQNMVITRTGHDLAYWSHLDTLVSEAIKCFQ